jgi:c-di-GMP-related signal transduction protein
MSTLADKVQQDLIQAIENDELVLPTLPEVALKVREAAEDPNISTLQLSKVIGNDAALTARIIKVVNSPLLRTSKEITDLQMAINRLGINYTCNLAIGLAMEQMFQATSDVVDRKMREMWTKSTEIAGICHVLCKQFTRLMPDQATLAGLIHQIGALPILAYAEDHNDLNIDIATHGCLQHWAEQGVLLLNTTLTVEQADAGSHAKAGWQHFTDRVIEVASSSQENLVFLLWGAHAQTKEKLIDASKHLVLKSVHPSPLSAYRGFIGNGHFSRTNKFLQQNGHTPIDWRLPAL